MEDALRQARDRVLVENTAQAVFKHLDRLTDNREAFRCRWISTPRNSRAGDFLRHFATPAVSERAVRIRTLGAVKNSRVCRAYLSKTKNGRPLQEESPA